MSPRRRRHRSGPVERSGGDACLDRCCGDACPERRGGDACLDRRGGVACRHGGDACRRGGEACVAVTSWTRPDPMASPAACAQAAASGSAASCAAKIKHCCIRRRSERVRGGAAAGPPRPPTSCCISATSSPSCCRCCWLRALRCAMSPSNWPSCSRNRPRASRVAVLLVPSLPCASSRAAAASIASRSAALTSSLSAAMWTCEHRCFRVISSRSILDCAAPRVLASVRPSARLRAVRHCCSCLRSRGVGDVYPASGDDDDDASSSSSSLAGGGVWSRRAARRRPSHANTRRERSCVG